MWDYRLFRYSSLRTSSVRGPKHVVRRGKTPVIKADQARALLDSVETGTIVGLRDRALLGLVLIFARAKAAQNWP
jgi:site-specific recombinase XerC